MSLSSPMSLVRGMCRSRALAAAILLTGFAGLPVQANHNPPAPAATGSLVDVQVIVGNRPAPLYFAPGRFDRHYFEARRGTNYSLLVRNLTGERVGVQIAVDGLNVVDGERSRLRNNEAMYVLDPWEEAEIRGWRTSLKDVRKFVFVDEKRSYAERSGKANADMGWIRVLAYREAGSPYLSRRDGRFREHSEEGRGAGPYAEGDATNGAPPAPAPSAGSADSRSQVRPESKSYGRDDDNPGTGWGEQSWDPVNRTSFLAQHRASDQFNLRYEYASGLLALGIDIRRHRDRLWEREQGDFGFAQPPKW